MRFLKPTCYLLFCLIFLGKVSFAQETPNKPPMYVLQVGISEYKNMKKYPELKGSINDIVEMKNLLMSDRFNIPESNFKTLLNGDAKKTRIFDLFQIHLIDNAKKYFEKTNDRENGAIILFQFSGHGSQVPDSNPKDEIDKKDETFVTWDSEDEFNKNSDITDDEIFELTSRLSKYTDNIVFILDSCHSGSGTRDGGDVRRVEARKTTPTPVLKEKNKFIQIKKTVADNSQTDFLPASDKYIVISAAKSEELAIPINHFATEQSQEPISFGLLTFCLIEELKNAKSDTSYERLMENVSKNVKTQNPSQTPQLEGDGKRFVFQGLAKREDYSIKILETNPTKKQITIKSGAMQGITPETIIAVYDKGLSEFQGENGRIATAKITNNVFADKSIAQVISSMREITPEDHVVIISPELGAKKLKVMLEGEDPAKLTEKDKTNISQLKEKLVTRKNGQIVSQEVDLINGTWRDKSKKWEVILLKDEFGKVFPDSKNKQVLCKDLPATKQIYYLAGKDFVPLYGICVDPESPEAVNKIEKYLLHISAIRSVKSIKNDKSGLNAMIQITPYLLKEPKVENGKIVDLKKQAMVINSLSKAFPIYFEDRYWLEIKNNSNKDLYFTILNIGTDGSVKVLLPDPTYEQSEGVMIKKNGGISNEYKLNAPLFKSTPPAGIETLKIIFSTEQIKRSDFEYLERSALRSKGGGKSLSDLPDWTTAEINLELKERIKP